MLRNFNEIISFHVIGVVIENRFLSKEALTGHSIQYITDVFNNHCWMRIVGRLDAEFGSRLLTNT